MFNNIVVALKPGLDSEPLVDLAVSVAAEGARMHLISLVRVGLDEDEHSRLKATERRVADLATGLGARGIDASYTASIIVSDAGEGVVRIARERAADLVVIGLAKRSRVGKALLGSDAQVVLMSGYSPVLSVRLVD